MCVNRRWGSAPRNLKLAQNKHTKQRINSWCGLKLLSCLISPWGKATRHRAEKQPPWASLCHLNGKSSLCSNGACVMVTLTRTECSRRCWKQSPTTSASGTGRPVLRSGPAFQAAVALDPPLGSSESQRSVTIRTPPGVEGRTALKDAPTANPLPLATDAPVLALPTHLKSPKLLTTFKKMNSSLPKIQ